MTDFDSRLLLRFKPPAYLCVRCRAFIPPWKEITSSHHRYITAAYECPVCQLQYVSQRQGYVSHRKVREFLTAAFSSETVVLDFHEPLAHAQRLAAIAAHLDDNHPLHNALDCLFAALNSAQRFVHFVTYNIDLAMCGVLGLLSQRIRVSGIVGLAHDSVAAEVERLKLNVKVYGKDRFADVPHQKIVIVDGLLAFKGSANLSTNAWHKASKSRQELIEAVTATTEIRQLNNRYFAPLWRIYAEGFEQPVDLDGDPSDYIPF